MNVSDKIIAELKNSGWQPNRRINTDEIVKFLTDEGYILNLTVLEFIQNLGNLELYPPAFRVEGKTDTMHFNPILAAEGIYPERVKEEYELRVGEPLVVVGAAYSEHLTLMLSHSGKLYGGYDSYLTLLGNSVVEALEGIFGRKESEEIPLLEEENV